ncbi:MAG: pyruvate kinase [Parachlamydiales bacterium]
MRIRTKIICTMGPAVTQLDKLLALIESGMSVARLNFSHGTHEEHARTIALIKEARERAGRPVAIMLDTKGPEIRVGPLEAPIVSKEGALLRLVPMGGVLKEGEVPINPPSVLKSLKKGAPVLFDDGLVVTRVVEVLADAVLVEGVNGGEIRSRKGINVPGLDLALPMVTEQDEADIRFGCQQGIEMIAASFVCYPEHIEKIKRILAEEGASDVIVAAKIESQKGVENFEAILQAADAIMIARGDLGVEVPLSQVPGLQKRMIRECYEAAKPSIVATQMLESMTHNMRPTRAEASDVAGAIYESASAVMLSGETAVGRYPVETVQTMRSIVEQAESEFNYQLFYSSIPIRASQDVPTSIALAAVKTAISASASALFVITAKGLTARLTSRLRPKMPIVTLTTSKRIYHQLAFYWGVIPVYVDKVDSFQEGFEVLSDYALKAKLVGWGDLVVTTAGVPFGRSGTTNSMVVKSIGNVLLRGEKGYGKRVTGVVEILSDTERGVEAKGKILVIPRVTSETLALIGGAVGVVLKGLKRDPEAEALLVGEAERLGIPVLIALDAVYSGLREGESATLDPENAIILGE